MLLRHRDAAHKAGINPQYPWRIVMHQPSRRQFVTTSLVGLPMLAGGTATLLGSPPLTLDGAEQRGLPDKLEAGVQSPSNSDPVLDAIVSDFREVRREGDEKPSQRRGAVRAIETLTGVLAAHLSKHYDADVKRAIRLQLQRKGRQALVHEITTRVNKSEITHEAIDAMLTRLERDGVGGVLREAQKSIKRMRENMPPDYLQVRSVTQYDFCSDLNWMIQLAEMCSAIACAVAMGSAGVNPAADAACAGTTAALAGYLAMKWWYN